MDRARFRVLYHEFLFRIVDLELLSTHAQGDSRTLLGQLASLLIFCSVILAVSAWVWAANVRSESVPALAQLISAWTAEHFLIATTMLVVGIFAVLSWESTFPDRRDVLVLGPLPVRARTLFLAKVAALAAALGLTVVALQALAGIAWPLALAQYKPVPAPALMFDPPLPPVHAADFPAVMNRDMTPMLQRLDLAGSDGRVGIVIGISDHGVRRIVAWGAAKPDSLFEIGSITKTFTALLLAQLDVRRKLDLRDPVRDLLSPGAAPPSTGLEITLLDLATHHSGLPAMPDNAGPPDRPESYTNYHASDLAAFIHRHGLGKSSKEEFRYSNLGYALLGAALASRAGMSYAELLRRDITGPLGMKDTVISPSPDQAARLLEGHDRKRRPIGPWDLDAFASAGGIRSTAGDLLTYLEAQLHPDRTPLKNALVESHLLRDYVAGNIRTALGWIYDPATGLYEHSGATPGFSSFAFFDPRHDRAAIALMNADPDTFPFIPVLSQHIQQRLAGAPALSLSPVLVPPAGPLRTFFAYWAAIAAAAVFTFCAVLAIQGLAAQILPRRWFLRASALLQLTVFCLLLSGYFLQRSPADVLIAGPHKPWLSWIPSYWFVGLYQQLSGSLHPGLAPFARRAWLGLALALCATAGAYGAAYMRTLRKIVEEPDIAPTFRNAWLPPFGGGFETAIVHFSIRTLLRSRQHRMIFAFYLGAGLAFALLFLNAPAELSGPVTESPWSPLSVPLLASTIVLMGFWVRGARVVFALPLDLRANWIFRLMPFAAGRECLRARRRALWAVSILPAWLMSAAVLFWFWPWRLAAAHLTIVACVGIVLAEFSTDSAQRLPFTCSWLPGRSNLHVTFWLWIYLILAAILGAAIT